MDNEPAFLSHSDFVKDDTKEHMNDIFYIHDKIVEGLKDTNLSDVYFWETYDGSVIYIQLMHKDIQGYVYTSINFNKDWDNKDEIIQKSIEEFKKLDNPKHLKGYKEFLADGEKWGWD